MRDGVAYGDQPLDPMVADPVQAVHPKDFTRGLDACEAELSAPAVFDQRPCEWVSFLDTVTEKTLGGDRIGGLAQGISIEEKDIRNAQEGVGMP